MSIRVLNEVLDKSRAQGTDRVVAVAIAEAAAHDGVAWIPQGPQDDRRSIAYRANCSVREVERAVQQLVAIGELEIRKAQRGRARINVYRVTVGRIFDEQVDYSRLPFELNEPFSTTRQSVGRSEDAHGGNQVSPGPADEADRRPDDLSGGQTGGRPDDLSPTTRHLVADDPTPTRARVGRSSGAEPSFNRPSNRPTAAAGSRGEASAAAALSGELEQLGVGSRLRLRACADVDRARAWLELAKVEADTNPAGFFRAGFESGEWPSPREDGSAKSGQTRAVWIEETSWRLEAEDAHSIVDDWRDLDDVERSRLHELVDEVRARREENPPAKVEAA